MSTRHTQTTETRHVTLRADLSNHWASIPTADLARAMDILWKPASDVTRWMNRTAVSDYQSAYQSQVMDLKILIRDDPHSRRIIMNGPPGDACWRYTSYLSHPFGGYEVCAHYRSVDRDHLMTDIALQLLIAREVTKDRVVELSMMIDSLHKYLP